MSNSFSDLYVVAGSYSNYSVSDERAFALSACPQCGGTQMGVVAFQKDLRQIWMRCVNCGHAIVANGGVFSPAPKPLSEPLGLAGQELAVWNEVRECLSVGAFTAAVMMCRKLLFHLAVAHGLPEKNEKGFAPTFIAAVQHLEDEGLITKHMRPWIDRIKDVGNEANHELSAIRANEASDVARFTEQLLKLTYEMPALIEIGRTEKAAASIGP